MKNKKAIILLAIAVFLVGIFVGRVLREKPAITLKPPISKTPIPSIIPKFERFETFKSEQELKDYIAKGQTISDQYKTETGVLREPQSKTSEVAPGEVALGGEKEIPEEISQTNIQVFGVDEPDIVKTDGEELYVSSPQIYIRPMPEMERRDKIESNINDRMPQYQYGGGTKLVKAFPPLDIRVDSSVDRNGELLLFKNNLIILTNTIIYGYDVSDTRNPEKKWELKFENNSRKVQARLFNKKLYLITISNINYSRPCPLKPFSRGDTSVNIACDEIYKPKIYTPVGAVYSAVIIDPENGRIENKISFVGSPESSIIYMSRKGLYITYAYQSDRVSFFLDFAQQNRDIFPSKTIDDLRNINNYEISERAKLIELENIIGQYINSLFTDDRVRAENELQNRMRRYVEENRGGLDRTGVVKLSVDNLKIEAIGSVPGKPLNQFSLDEYQEYLRIATTINRRRTIAFPYFGSISMESANDVYVLDKDLDIRGFIKNLGISEEIYGVRFVGDRGYVVTFRQTDPLFVIDLSDEENPQLKGELKIPGYSSYLHPVREHYLIGIGKENQYVKISLFDTSLSDNPIELDKYILNDFWSDILNTHHAFLLDNRHKIFFLPGSNKAYIFSYEGDILRLIKTVSQTNAKRAIYINDYLYIVGDNKIMVLSEKDWQKINEIDI
jgi:uncharacterized secreted protein with C-terminal beta-propeller domain